MTLQQQNKYITDTESNNEWRGDKYDFWYYSILINFFTVKVSGYDVLSDLKISFPLFL
jgi:hypothetical protein